MSANEPHQKPIVERLDDVPPDARMWYDTKDDEGYLVSSQHLPVGRLAREAATALREQAAEIERLTTIIDNSPLDELHGCDCCGATTTDAVEVDGHMQCRACSFEAKNERLRTVTVPRLRLHRARYRNQVIELQSQLATARAEGESAFRAGYSAGLDACGESTDMLDENAAFQIHQRAQAKQGETGDE